MFFSKHSIFKLFKNSHNFSAKKDFPEQGRPIKTTKSPYDDIIINKFRK